MKCERLVSMFRVVCDDGTELFLESDFEFQKVWYLRTDKVGYITVSQIYDIAKSVLDGSDEQTVEMITVEVLGGMPTINRQTTKEEYLTTVIGNVSCNSRIDRY